MEYANKYYDPDKAHEYYMQTRELKGYEHRYDNTDRSRGGPKEKKPAGRPSKRLQSYVNDYNRARANSDKVAYNELSKIDRNPKRDKKEIFKEVRSVINNRNYSNYKAKQKALSDMQSEVESIRADSKLTEDRAHFRRQKNLMKLSTDSISAKLDRQIKSMDTGLEKIQNETKNKIKEYSSELAELKKLMAEDSSADYSDRIDELTEKIDKYISDRTSRLDKLKKDAVSAQSETKKQIDSIRKQLSELMSEREEGNTKRQEEKQARIDELRERLNELV